MKRKHWTDQEKFAVVIEGLRGDMPVSELCAKYGVHQSQYYKWRELFLSEGAKVFAVNKENQKERQMQKKMQRMERVIGELTLELKKRLKRSRAPSLSRQSKDVPLVSRIQAIKSDHPFWGYRRIWAYLRFRQRLVVGKNRVYRIMKEKHFLVEKNERLKAKRGALKPKPQAGYLNQYWGMDMTKIRFPSGWHYLHVVKGWFSKEIIGCRLSTTSTASDWLDALDDAVNRQYPHGIAKSALKPKLITDNGCQPTSTRFLKACGILGIEQIFTCFNNPKGNADTERVIRTIKEDLVWPFDWQCPIAFEKHLKQWVSRYNHDFPHMSLGWKTPAQFANNTLLNVA